MAEDLTVLIANLGQPDNLLACLKSLYETASGKVSLRVIVGFNFAGASNTPRTLAREFPQVEQMRAPVKLGYCRAYNQLMALSTGRYVLLLDDDTLLRPGTIDGMVRFMDEHPDVGIAGCRTVNPDGSYQKSTALMYSLGTEIRNIVRPAAFWNDGINDSLASWTPAGWLNGHFMMVRRRVIEALGGFDEYYYTLQSEADWCLRIRRAGWTIAYVPAAEVMHIGGEHSVNTNVKSYKNLMRSHINRYYFMRKHYGAGAAFLFRAIMSAGALLRLLRYCVSWLFDPGRRPEAGPKIAAYWKIVLLGAAAQPEKLPEDLRRESFLCEVLEPAGLKEVQPPS